MARREAGINSGENLGQALIEGMGTWTFTSAL